MGRSCLSEVTNGDEDVGYCFKDYLFLCVYESACVYEVEARDRHRFPGTGVSLLVGSGIQDLQRAAPALYL